MKIEKLANWHYDKYLPAEKDELTLKGRVELNEDTTLSIEAMLKAPYENGGVKRIHTGDPALATNNESINQRSRLMREVGYTEQDYFIEFNDSLPALASIMKEQYGVYYSHYCSVIIEPGQCMPAHGDTYSFLMKQLATHHPSIKYELHKNVRRYLTFLTDWEWGQCLGAGNQIVWQWKAGDVFAWRPQLIHWCSNASFTPIMFFEISGLNFL